VGRVRKAVKLGILLALVVAGGALAYAGARPSGFLGVEDVVADPAAHAGRELELKGTIVEGSLNRSATGVSFTLADGHAQLPVQWDPSQPLPDHEAGGTIEGKNVVVTGSLVSDASGVHLLATKMSVGCASKYRPA